MRVVHDLIINVTDNTSSQIITIPQGDYQGHLIKIKLRDSKHEFLTLPKDSMLTATFVNKDHKAKSIGLVAIDNFVRGYLSVYLGSELVENFGRYVVDLVVSTKDSTSIVKANFVVVVTESKYNKMIGLTYSNYLIALTGESLYNSVLKSEIGPCMVIVTEDFKGTDPEVEYKKGKIYKVISKEVDGKVVTYTEDVTQDFIVKGEVRDEDIATDADIQQYKIKGLVEDLESLRDKDDHLQSQVDTIIESYQEKLITRTLLENTVTETFDAPNAEQVLILQDENKTGSIKFDKDNDEVTITSNDSLHLDANKISQNQSKVISDKNIALGDNNTAGCKVFKIVNLIKDPLTITLDSIANIEIGDDVSIVADYNANFVGTVKEIQGTSLIIDGSLYYGFPDFDPSKQNYLWLPNKPDVGNVELGSGIFVVGRSNKGNQSNSFTAGYNNVNDGKFGAVFGSGNKGGYCDFVTGKNNKAGKAQTSLVTGQNNTVTNVGNNLLLAGSNNTVDVGNNMLIAGSNNTVDTGNGGIIAGQNNINKSEQNASLLGSGLQNDTYSYDQTIVGKFNVPKNGSLFIVGNGTDDSNRNNALVVEEDGSAKLSKQGTSEDSITRKDYVDTELKTLSDKKVSRFVSTDNILRGYASLNGQDIVFRVDDQVISGAVVKRQGTQIHVDTTPIENTHATSKIYVDTADKKLAEQIASITAVQIRNKSEVINSTEDNVQTVATNYIVTNYGRQPQNFDGLIITVTDKNNDKILYIYSEVSKLWINSGINDIDLSNYYTKDDLASLSYMSVSGTVDTLPTSTSGYKNGDVILVTGANDQNKGKRYVCYNNKWYNGLPDPSVEWRRIFDYEIAGKSSQNVGFVWTPDVIYSKLRLNMRCIVNPTTTEDIYVEVITPASADTDKFTSYRRLLMHGQLGRNRNIIVTIDLEDLAQSKLQTLDRTTQCIIKESGGYHGDADFKNEAPQLLTTDYKIKVYWKNPISELIQTSLIGTLTPDVSKTLEKATGRDTMTGWEPWH